MDPPDTPILVTGGTGTLGRLVVPRLRAAGHDVRVLSRRPHDDAAGVTHVVGDLATGEGIAAAVAGVEVVVHCAGSSSGDEDKARHLVRAAGPAGVRHVVNVSVVGADRVPQGGRLDRMMFGYFGTKLAADRVVALAAGPPSGLVPDIAGPRAIGMDELLWSYLRAAGRRRPVVRVRVPGRAARALRAGANLAPDRAVGTRTWEDFLAARVPAPAPKDAG